MNIETIYLVVDKLLGEINPIGESTLDRERFENLKLRCELITKLLVSVDAVWLTNKGSAEYSRKRAARYADNYIKNLNSEV